MQEMRVRSLGQEDALEKGMATHSSILAWRIPWTEEPGRLQSTGSPRMGHSQATQQQQQQQRHPLSYRNTGTTVLEYYLWHGRLLNSPAQSFFCIRSGPWHNTLKRGGGEDAPTILFCWICIYFFEVELTYNVVLVSGVQRSDSDIYTLFKILFHYKLL